MGQRILIVEDEDLVRMLLEEALSDAGYETAVAWNGDRAIAMMNAANPFDLLLTDITMPGKADGNAVAVRAKQVFPGLPVLYVSGRPDSVKNAMGCRDVFVAKPFGIKELVVAVGVMMPSKA